MPKLPRNWVPGKGFQKKASTPTIPSMQLVGAKEKPGYLPRMGPWEPPRRGVVQWILEKTPLEWTAIGVTTLLILSIAHASLTRGGRPATERGVAAAPGGAGSRVTGYRPEVRVASLEVIDGEEEDTWGAFAFEPLPRANVRPEAVVRYVDILPQVEFDGITQERLLRVAMDPLHAEREEAIRDLREAGPLAMPYLLAVFDVGLENPRVQPTLMETLVRILGRLQDPAARAAVRRAARCDIPVARQAALVLLADGRDPEAIDLSIQGLGDGDPAVRVRAEQILRNAGAAAHPALAKALHYGAAGNEEKVQGVLRLLLGEPFPEAVEPAADLLRHRSAEVRRAAVRTLGSWTAAPPGNRNRIVRAVRGALADEDPGVRSQAALSLLALDDKECLEKLLDLLLDSDPLCRESARRALAGLAGVDVGGSHLAWKEFLEGRNAR